LGAVDEGRQSECGLRLLLRLRVAGRGLGYFPRLTGTRGIFSSRIAT
jgi:hypothetical protein